MNDNNVEIEMNKLEVFNNEDYITDSYVAVLRKRYNKQLLVQQQSVDELKSILDLLEVDEKSSNVIEKIKHVIITLEVTSNDKQIASPSKHSDELSPVPASLYLATAYSPQTTVDSSDDSFYLNELDSLRMENIKLKVDICNFEKALNQRNNVAKQVLQLSVNEADEINRLAGELKVTKQQCNELSKRSASVEANIVREVESRVNYYRKITSMSRTGQLADLVKKQNINPASAPMTSPPSKGDVVTKRTLCNDKNYDKMQYQNIIKNYKTRENELITALEAVVNQCQHLERQKNNHVVFR